jgi:3-oxoacyl-[acyl-carrier-protein] synthase III
MNTSDVHLLSVGTALPGAPIDNAALGRRFGMGPQWEEWIDFFIGTKTRHLSLDLDTGEARYTLADLCAIAANRALAAAELRPGEVDLVVMATSTPDVLMPATVNVVADTLGIDGVPTYQLQSGCTGAVQALGLAHQLLQTGQYRNALIIGGDISVKFYDVGVDMTALPQDQLVHYVLFGDGAGAAVLSSGDAVPGSAIIRRVFTRLTGLDRAPGQMLDWFGPADRGSDRAAAVQDYKAIEASVPPMSVEVLAELLDDLDWKSTEIDYLLPPQLSGRMTARIVNELCVPGAREISCVTETGNNGNGTPFFQLERALSKMITGERAVGISIESSKWIKAGFAVEKS